MEKNLENQQEKLAMLKSQANGKTNENEISCKEIDPNAFRGVEAKVKSGHTYPNLFTQASYLERDLERVDRYIIKISTDMFLGLDIELIDFMLDCMYSRCSTYIETANDIEGEQEVIGHFKELESELYSLGDFTKKLSDLYNTKRYKERIEREIEHTKNLILL